eukprot:scaffold11527_cov105-Skeletonema_dohrnii-CCMP3373.AAC.1
MLFRWLAEEEVALAAAKSLNEFCLANSLKADSKVDGVAATESTRYKKATRVLQSYRFIITAISLHGRRTLHRSANGTSGAACDTVIIKRVQIGVGKFVSGEDDCIRLGHHNHDVGGRGIVEYHYHGCLL